MLELSWPTLVTSAHSSWDPRLGGVVGVGSRQERRLGPSAEARAQQWSWSDTGGADCPLSTQGGGGGRLDRGLEALIADRCTLALVASRSRGQLAFTHCATAKSLRLTLRAIRVPTTLPVSCPRRALLSLTPINALASFLTTPNLA